MAARLSTKEEYKTLLDQYDTWLFDCDGVLWQGNRLIPGAKELLAYLRSIGTSARSPARVACLWIM